MAKKCGMAHRYIQKKEKNAKHRHMSKAIGMEWNEMNDRKEGKYKDKKNKKNETTTKL